MSTAAEDAYRRAPETVAELVAEVERLRAEKLGLEISESNLLVELRNEVERLRAAIERARALAENLATVDTVWFWHTDYIRDYFLSALKEDQ
ncbi:hypothetical protein SEA_BUBBLES123_48 [Mycobacterium phage Bubbles123]|uniref:Uncharacterized protein n=1 Tax=Mycobacterium phage Bubbles123 TaxID=1932895 RepID=A0A1P8DU61_9CAUD|nr:hypothetical protein I5H18_gp048 [Mycobacterium phage Bubbles123]APU93049.1 hypothetical protein SEA_BUBBLES123_48 [Mycobacterium phage Bubbles123]